MSSTYTICLLPGDGIGPEIMDEAVKVLEAISKKFDVSFTYQTGLIGGVAIDATANSESQTALPQETLDAATSSDAVLLGAVGGPRWDSTDPDAVRPEQGLLGIRKALQLYINLRPVRIYDALRDEGALKPEYLQGVDMLIVRELTGGLYFGERQRDDACDNAKSDGSCGRMAYDTMIYHEYEIERIVRFACEASAKRRCRLHSVDKANVLESGRLWREVAHEVIEDYPMVELIDQLVDNTAMQLINNPSQFDVIVTENTFGDILSDEASMLTGSLGMLASASLGDGVSLYEPSHGSAPTIAGQGVANPLAQILSVELMLRYSFNMDDAADALSHAVEAVLNEGWRTNDTASTDTPTDKIVGTTAMGDLVVEHL